MKIHGFLHIFLLKKYINLNKSIRKKRFENDLKFCKYNLQLKYKAAINIRQPPNFQNNNQYFILPYI